MSRPKGQKLPGDPMEYVDRSFRDSVRDAFRGAPIAIRLSEDQIFFRRSGGAVGPERARWLTPTRYQTARGARRYLALPNENTARDEAIFTIPKGAIILWGKAASQADVPEFGRYATGGGEQVYLPDVGRARREAAGGSP